MRYEFWEYNWLTGHGKCIGEALSAGCLPWEACDDLNTYIVLRRITDSNTVTYLAEFNGSKGQTVRTWFVDHADYDGSNGCWFWEGIIA